MATLQLRRTFQARRTQVFRAWTDPEAVKRWWLPGPGYAVPEARFDVRAGGAYRVAMRNPKGEVFHLSGTYREVEAPARLVYTWRWEKPEMDIGETVVTVEFHEHGASTEVVITHELFPADAARDQHRGGWTACLDHLPEVLSR
jgi:uncharacterized protein YndB with AHSA1/START domain